MKYLKLLSNSVCLSYRFWNESTGRGKQNKQTYKNIIYFTVNIKQPLLTDNKLVNILGNNLIYGSMDFSMHCCCYFDFAF